MEKYNFDIPVAQIYFGQHHCTMGYSLSEKVKKRKYSCSFIDWLYVLMDKSCILDMYMECLLLTN